MDDTIVWLRALLENDGGMRTRHLQVSSNIGVGGCVHDDALYASLLLSAVLLSW